MRLLGWTDKLMHGLTMATSFWLPTTALSRAAIDSLYPPPLFS